MLPWNFSQVLLIFPSHLIKQDRFSAPLLHSLVVQVLLVTSSDFKWISSPPLVGCFTSITYNNTFSGFAFITELTNRLQFTDSTPDIPEDPWKLAHTTVAPSFGPPTFKKTPCIILLIKWMDVEVTSQVVWILGPVFAKVPQTNTHIHTLYDHFTTPSI